MQFDSYLPNFGDAKLVSRERVADLPKRHRVVSAKRFEAWVARLLSNLHATKERFECFIRTGQRVIKHIGVNRRYVGSVSANIWQLVNLIEAADRLVLKFIGVAPFLQASIVKFTTNRKVIVKRLSLALAWIKSVLINFVGHAARVLVITKVLVKARWIVLAVCRAALILTYSGQELRGT